MQLMSFGASLINEERNRQISKEGFDEEHDDQHDNGELASAAVAYAAPVATYEGRQEADRLVFSDPWPWDACWDKRSRVRGRRLDLSSPAGKPSSARIKKRIRDLVKAGALIAAEIDRLHRIAERRS